MKILTFTENFLVGRLETRILSIHEELRRHGHQTVIYGINVLDKLKAVKKIKLLDANDLLSIHNLTLIESILVKEKPDFIDIHPFTTIGLCGLVSLVKSIPFSITLHGAPSLEYLLSNDLAHDIAAQANHIYCVSNLLLEKTNKEFPTTSSSISPNGIKFPTSYRETGKPIAKRSLLIVSRLDKYKSTVIEHFINDFSETKIARELIESIDLIGAGSELERLKKLAKKKLNINFIGPQRAIDLMPKYWLVGGVGRVIIEAASQNIPALLLDYEGVAGLISKDNYQYFSKKNFVRSDKHLDHDQIDAQFVDLMQNYGFYQCRINAEQYNSIEKIVLDYQEKLVNSSTNHKLGIDLTSTTNVEVISYISKKGLGIHNVNEYNSLLRVYSDLKEKSELIIEKDRVLYEKQEHLNKIYNGRLWKALKLYFDGRDLLIKAVKKPFHIPQKLRRLVLQKMSELRFRKELDAIIKNDQAMIALPTIDWNTPLYQRPQHLAIQISKNNKFIFCTLNHKYDQIYGIKTINKNLVVTNLWQDAVKLQPKSWILLLSTQQLITISQIEDYIGQGSKIIYDYVDEIHEDISGSDSLTDFLVKRHNYIKHSGCAEIVLCVSRKLYDEMLEHYPKEKVLLVPNGVDYNHFQVKCDAKHIPEDLKITVGRERPIIGYYGAMANWLDYDLINQTATQHPEWEFVYIGIDYNGGLAKLNQSLENVHFLGQKDYKELPQYGIWFDIATIPFAKGEIAKSTSPIKMYEYMAMRKPIVATEDMVECYGYDGVFVSKNTVADFESKIQMALDARNERTTFDALDVAARENTWEKRAEIIVGGLKLRANHSST